MTMNPFATGGTVPYLPAYDDGPTDLDLAQIAADRAGEKVSRLRRKVAAAEVGHEADRLPQLRRALDYAEFGWERATARVEALAEDREPDQPSCVDCGDPFEPVVRGQRRCGTCNATKQGF